MARLCERTGHGTGHAGKTLLSLATVQDVTRGVQGRFSCCAPAFSRQCSFSAFSSQIQSHTTTTTTTTTITVVTIHINSTLAHAIAYRIRINHSIFSIIVSRLASQPQRTASNHPRIKHLHSPRIHVTLLKPLNPYRLLPLLYFAIDRNYLLMKTIMLPIHCPSSLYLCPQKPPIEFME